MGARDRGARYKHDGGPGASEVLSSRTLERAQQRATKMMWGLEQHLLYEERL